MLLATLFSTFHLLTSPIVINSSMEIIHQHHLETVEGRTTFLVDILAPFAAAADQLNHEIETQAQAISALSPENDQQQIVTLTQAMTQKMTELVTMMSVLNSTQSLKEDFLQIESIMRQTDPLTPEQLEIVDRVASLCSSLTPHRIAA